MRKASHGMTMSFMRKYHGRNCVKALLTNTTHGMKNKKEKGHYMHEGRVGMKKLHLSFGIWFAYQKWCILMRKRRLLYKGAGRLYFPISA
jgi:hypothetical protein